VTLKDGFFVAVGAGLLLAILGKAEPGQDSIRVAARCLNDRAFDSCMDEIVAALGALQHPAWHRHTVSPLVAPAQYRASCSRVWYGRPVRLVFSAFLQCAGLAAGAFPFLSTHSLTAGTRVEASCPLSNNFVAPKLRARLAVSASVHTDIASKHDP
jgi:hypothetical protein